MIFAVATLLTAGTACADNLIRDPRRALQQLVAQNPHATSVNFNIASGDTVGFNVTMVGYPRDTVDGLARSMDAAREILIRPVGSVHDIQESHAPCHGRPSHSRGSRALLLCSCPGS
jgi:hypothetical protein